MRYPLDNYEQLATGYRFGQATEYSDFHLGIDKGNRTNYGLPIKRPTRGRITAWIHDAPEGGNTIHFLDSNGKLWRFLHLKGFANVPGEGPEGEIIGWMGNTGKVYPKPNFLNPKAGTHLHYDISSNGRLELNNRANFIDPELYIKANMTNQLPIKNGQTMLVVDDHGKWYLIQDGKKSFIPDRPTAWVRGLLSKDAIGATKEIADRYPDGPQLQYKEGEARLKAILDDVNQYYRLW